jgi:hypothetical protein
MIYRNDPIVMEARFDSICHTCGEKISKGAKIVYWPREKKAGHWKCDEGDYLKCKSAMMQEDYGMPC